jgi:hypothetical protein
MTEQIITVPDHLLPEGHSEAYIPPTDVQTHTPNREIVTVELSPEESAQRLSEAHENQRQVTAASEAVAEAFAKGNAAKDDQL